MRTDQWFWCEVCEWVITLCECPDGPTPVVTLADEPDEEEQP